jgi:alkanesulfonate monooxygenase SsuD/methylene tetrahydromethanopterin reductase-like flavin-dependent oxidoreductase (luciferase family)
MPVRPFRFVAAVFAADSAEAWAGRARQVESLGYDTLSIGDHFAANTFAPVPALMAAAAATTIIRIACTSFANDLRHPALLAKEAASLDVLSGGRLDVGIGAGWAKWE